MLRFLGKQQARKQGCLHHKALQQMKFVFVVFTWICSKARVIKMLKYWIELHSSYFFMLFTSDDTPEAAKISKRNTEDSITAARQRFLERKRARDQQQVTWPERITATGQMLFKGWVEPRSMCSHKVSCQRWCQLFNQNNEWPLLHSGSSRDSKWRHVFFVCKFLPPCWRTWTKGFLLVSFC